MTRKTPSNFLRASGATPKTPASSDSQRQPPSTSAQSTAPNTPATPATPGTRQGSAKDAVVKRFKTPIFESPNGQLVELAVVNISNQALTTVPDTVFENKLTGILDVSYNNISQIGHSISQLPYLQEFHADNIAIRCRNSNDTDNLSKNFAKLMHLKVLSIQCCNLMCVPPVIWEMKNLTELYLNRNRIGTLPPEIAKLKKLRKLNLQLTGISTLPPEIAYCQDLEELIIYGNPIQSLPETVAELNQLKVLGISYRVFTTANVDQYMESLIQRQQIQSEHISPVVFQLKSLKDMDLSFTKINTFPQHSLKSLTILDLSHNYIRNFPEAVTKLEKLRELNLSHNELSMFPDSLAQLAGHLKRLKISNNLFEIIPDIVFQLLNLRELHCNNNFITEIDEKIANLEKLKQLHLAHNKLTVLPDFLGKLINLDTIDVRKNDISEIPKTIHRMQSMEGMHSFNGLRPSGLWLLGNPNLKVPPPIVWMGDDIGLLCDSVRRLAVQNLSKDGDLNPTRLVLVGPRDDLKTEIVRHLKGASFIDKGNNICSIHRWNTKNGVPFVIYDLHTEFDATKRLLPFFMSKTSIFLLVFPYADLENSDPECDSPLDPYLDAISVSAPGSVVKLVACSDEENMEISPVLCNDRAKTEVMKHFRKIAKKISKFGQYLENQSGTDKLPAMQRINEENRQRLKHLKHLKDREILLRTCRDVTLVTKWDDSDRWEELEWQMELLATNEALTPHVITNPDRSWLDFGKRLLRLSCSLISWPIVEQEAAIAGVDEICEALKFLEASCLVCRFVNRKWVLVRPSHIMNVLEMILGKEPKLDVEVLKYRAHFPKDKLSEALDNYRNKGNLSEALLKCAIFYPTVNKQTSMVRCEHFLEEFGLGFIRNNMDEKKQRNQNWFTTPIIGMTGDDDDDKQQQNMDDLDESWPPQPDNETLVRKLAFYPVVGGSQQIEKLYHLFLCRLHDEAWLFLKGQRRFSVEIRRSPEMEFSKAFITVAFGAGSDQCLNVSVQAQDELFASWALDIVANVVADFYDLYQGILLSDIDCQQIEK